MEEKSQTQLGRRQLTGTVAQIMSLGDRCMVAKL